MKKNSGIKKGFYQDFSNHFTTVWATAAKVVKIFEKSVEAFYNKITVLGIKI